MSAAAVVMSGPPGGGKTTAAALLSRRAVRRGVPLAVLDQDTLTGPLTRVVARQAGHPGDLDHPAVRPLIREPTYQALTGVAEDVLRGGVGCVLVAPFTAERRDPARWRTLRDRLSAAGADRVLLAWATCPPDVLLARLTRRGAARDGAKLADPAAWLRSLDLAPPAVPHLALDTSGDPATLTAALDTLLASSYQDFSPQIEGKSPGRRPPAPL